MAEQSKPIEVNPNRPIQSAWEGFAKAVVIPGMPSWQIDSMKSVFFGGAMAAASVINETNDSGGDVNQLFDRMEVEFDEWEAELRQKAALVGSVPAGRA